MKTEPIKKYKKVELGQTGRLDMIDDEKSFKKRKQSIYLNQLGNNTIVKDYNVWYNHFTRENSNILTSKQPKSNMRWLKEHYEAVEQFIYEKYVSKASPVSGVGLYKY
jgi:hypothetical protein